MKNSLNVVNRNNHCEDSLVWDFTMHAVVCHVKSEQFSCIPRNRTCQLSQQICLNIARQASWLLHLKLLSYFVGNRKIDLGFLVDDWSTSPRLKTKDASRANARAGESVKDLIRTIYGSFPVEDDSVRVGLVKSGATAQVLFDFNKYKDLDSLDEAVEGLAFPTSTVSNIGNSW